MANLLDLFSKISANDCFSYNDNHSVNMLSSKTLWYGMVAKNNSFIFDVNDDNGKLLFITLINLP